MLAENTKDPELRWTQDDIQIFGNPQDSGEASQDLQACAFKYTYPV